MSPTSCRPRRRLVCYWCAEPLTLSLAVVAEGWVWHRVCFERTSRGRSAASSAGTRPRHEGRTAKRVVPLPPRAAHVGE